MYRPVRSIPGDELRAFDLKNCKGVPEWMTRELLADLWDCAWKYGITVVSYGSRDLTQQGYSFHVSVPIDPHERALGISQGGPMEDGAHIFTLPRGGLAIWDMRVSVEEALEFIHEVDQRRTPWGWRSATTGERFRVQDLCDDREYKRSVEQTFRLGMALLPGEDPWVARDRFDRPELIAVLETPFGGKLLCHVRDKERLEAEQRVRASVLPDVLHEFGYNSWRDVPMDADVVGRIRAAVSQRLGVH